MKRNILMIMGLLSLDLSLLPAQTALINSWENSTEGWTINEPWIWTNSANATIGATAGSNSWRLIAGSGPDYGAALSGPSSTALGATLAHSASVSVDVLASNFIYLQWDLVVYQPGGLGNVSVDGYAYSQSPAIGAESTLTWTIPGSVRTALLNNPSLPVSLIFLIGGGGPGTVYLDNLRATVQSSTPADLWVRELWDDIPGEEIPALTAVTDNVSSAGFASTPWVVNPAETNNCRLMAFRPGFNNEPFVGSLTMGLPGTLDGTAGCLVQENSGFSFFPGPAAPTFWSDGIFMTRELATNNYIDFQAAGEYWFSLTIASPAPSLYSMYVTFPASGWAGLGFADGSTTNANFVAVGVTGPDVYIGPTNSTSPWGQTNVSRALYISQGTLGQPGNTNSTVYNPLTDPDADPPEPAPPFNQFYSQTNFTGGPYHINAFGDQTIGRINGDCFVLVGRLTTHGDGTATVDAKYYGVVAGANPWNTELDVNTNSITWDCSYSFSYGGTMMRMLLFENGQFPLFVFGFRASKNFQDVVGLDPGRIAVAPASNPHIGLPIQMTNLVVEANAASWASPPGGYGDLNYQWYQNGAVLVDATNRYLNIASAAPTNAGIYTCVTTDPSGTWRPATNVVTIAAPIPPSPLPQPIRVQMLGPNCLQVFFSETDITGVDDMNHYVFSGGIVGTNITVFNTADATVAQILTTALPAGTRITLTVSDLTNSVGRVLVSADLVFWTDLVQSGVANWSGWQCPAFESIHDYFQEFVPAYPSPLALQSMVMSSWDGPSTGITILGLDGYVADYVGGKLTGWFIPPVTTNYVFFVAADDCARLSLSTNSSSTSLFVIACESLWAGPGQWTNVFDQYPTGPHRGDGNTNSSLQNRSDQFLAAYDEDLNGIWTNAVSHVTNVIVPGTPFWPNRDSHGQAIITLEAGQRYYLELEHMQQGGGYNEGVTYKIGGQPDPASPSASLLTGTNIAGFVPFRPAISIADTPGGPRISYAGILLSGTTPLNVTTPVAISSNGVCVYDPAVTNGCMFYRTSR